MNSNKIIADFTDGSILRHLTRFMLPFMAANALQVLYSLVDMLIVGNYVGSAGLSGVAQGGSTILFATIFTMGFSNSGQILVSQLLGADKRECLGKVISTLFCLVAFISVVISAAAVFLREHLLNFLNVPPEAWDMASDYILICGTGLIFTNLYNVVAAVLRGAGDSRHPFVFISISSGLNLVLDLILTGALGLGVVGAAVATVISQALCFFLSIAFLICNRADFYINFCRGSFRLDASNAAAILKLGFPLAIQAGALSISMMLGNSFINRLGVAASATFGVGMKIDDIAMKISQGVQYAAAPIVGQNAGARKTARVQSTVLWTWLASAAIFALFFLTYVFLGKQIFGLFTDDTDVIELSPVFIRAISICFPAMAIMRGTSALLQGTGSTGILMWLAFMDSTLRLVFSYILGIVLDMGFFGFVLGYGGAAYGVAIPGMIYFFSGRWKKKCLVDSYHH